MNFDQFAFSPNISAAILAAGYSHPTPIQEQAIPLVLEGRDIVGLAQTGTGKTAAFILPLLQKLEKNPTGPMRVLIIEPTRELAEQVHQNITILSGKRTMRSATIYGGTSRNMQIRNIRRGFEIFVGCPGRLLDLIEEGQMDISSIETLVLDEADRLFDMGFLPDIRRIMMYLPARRQTLLFSATMPKEIRQLTNTILKSPARLQVGASAPVKSVAHALYPCSASLKQALLLSILKETPTGRVLVFTKTKRRACGLAATLSKNGYRTAALQGDMRQTERQSSINGFRKGKYDILVATDIAARGIDVPEITHVINFDMPDSVDDYTHRIGRTGRAACSGEAWTLTVADDEPIIRQIEHIIGSAIERRRLPGFAPEINFAETNPNSRASSLGLGHGVRKFRMSNSAKKRFVRGRHQSR